jgi:hypothetical protein
VQISAVFTVCIDVHVQCTSCLYQLDGNISKNPPTKIYEVGVRSGHLVALTDIFNENLIECWTLDFCSCEKKYN